VRNMERRLRKLEGRNPLDRLSDAELDQAIDYLLAEMEGRTPDGDMGPAGRLVFPRHMFKEVANMPEAVLDAEIARLLSERVLYDPKQPGKTCHQP
jgi:hypothetical protein